MGAALGQPPEREQEGPEDTMPHHLRGGVALFLRQAQQFPPALVRRGKLGALPVDRRLPVRAGKSFGMSPNSRHSSHALA